MASTIENPWKKPVRRAAPLAVRKAHEAVHPSPAIQTPVRRRAPVPVTPENLTQPLKKPDGTPDRRGKARFSSISIPMALDDLVTEFIADGSLSKNGLFRLAIEEFLITRGVQVPEEIRLKQGPTAKTRRK